MFVQKWTNFKWRSEMVKQILLVEYLLYTKYCFHPIGLYVNSILCVYMFIPGQFYPGACRKIKWICLIVKFPTGNVLFLMLIIDRLGLLRLMLDYLLDSAPFMEWSISSWSPVHSPAVAASPDPIFGIERLDARSSLSGETFDCLPSCAPSSIVRVFAINLLYWTTSPH